jgi:hypothetical protein
MTLERGHAFKLLSKLGPVEVGASAGQHRHTEWVAAALEALSSTQVANWKIGWAAVVVVLAASGRLHRAAAPLEAVLANVEGAAASAGRWA